MYSLAQKTGLQFQQRTWDSVSLDSIIKLLTQGCGELISDVLLSYGRPQASSEKWCLSVLGNAAWGGYHKRVETTKIMSVLSCMCREKVRMPAIFRSCICRGGGYCGHCPGYPDSLHSAEGLNMSACRLSQDSSSYRWRVHTIKLHTHRLCSQFNVNVLREDKTRRHEPMFPIHICHLNLNWAVIEDKEYETIWVSIWTKSW